MVAESQAVATVLYCFCLGRHVTFGKCGQEDIETEVFGFGQNFDMAIYRCRKCGRQGLRVIPAFRFAFLRRRSASFCTEVRFLYRVQLKKDYLVLNLGAWRYRQEVQLKNQSS